MGFHIPRAMASLCSSSEKQQSPPFVFYFQDIKNIDTPPKNYINLPPARVFVVLVFNIFAA
jgi:hypothetical protein